MPRRVKRYPVAPDAVYVWRGFMAPGLNFSGFAGFLGSVFVPACALLQPNVGLRAYLPTMVPQAGKPTGVPDQTALMFWANPQAHDLANQAIAVRIYQQLHGDVYDMNRSKLPEVPAALSSAGNTLTADQPYYLFDQSADWMLGAVNHLVGARRPDLAATDFLAQAFAWAAGFRSRPAMGIDAALLCCGSEYVAAWVHAADSTLDLTHTLDGLAALTVPVLRQNPAPFSLDAGLWDAWPGLDLTRDTCLNIQLQRPAAAKPRPREHA